MIQCLFLTQLQSKPVLTQIFYNYVPNNSNISLSDIKKITPHTNIISSTIHHHGGHDTNFSYTSMNLTRTASYAVGMSRTDESRASTTRRVDGFTSRC
jgi:hypothetical protein